MLDFERDSDKDNVFLTKRISQDESKESETKQGLTMMQCGGRERSANEARHVTERYLGPVRSRAYLTWTNAESTLGYLKKRDEEEQL